MATMIKQQVVLDEALIPSAQRLRIGRSNFRLPSDIQSKESTLQVEFWATATVHQHSIRFKMDTRKHIVDLEAFREMLHISPRVPGQSFAELPFEEEILEFLRFLGHSAQIKTLTDNTQQYGAIIPIELTTEDIRNTKPYKEYYACATGEAAPKPKASAKKKKDGSASSTTPPTPIASPTLTTTVVAAPRLSAAAKGKLPARATSPADPSDVERTKAEQLKIVLRRSMHETHISQQGGSNTDEGTGSRPGVPDVPSDYSEEEISWNSFDDEDVDDQTKGSDDNEELLKTEDDGNGEEDQGLRISEEERMHEEEKADELYCDVDINQGRGLQVFQDIEDSHLTLTLTHSDVQQESLSTSSFMTNLLNPIIDPGMESIFTTGSSTVTPIPSPKSTMTPSIRTTTTTASKPPIPLTLILSDVLQTLPTFASVFCFEDKTYRLQDSIQSENDEFLRTIDDNMKKIIKEQVKSQVKAQVTRILPRIKESVNAQLEAEVLTRLSYSSRTSYAVAADLSEMEQKKILIDKMEGNKSILKRRREEDDDQEGLSTGSDRGSKRRREGGEHASASTPSELATESAGRSTTGTQSRQLSASESAFAEEPVQTTYQMGEPSHPVFKTGAEDQPIVQTSQHPEWFSQPRRPPTPDRDWNKSLPSAQGNAQSWISVLAKKTDARSSFNELLDTPIDFSNYIMNRLGVDTLTPELLAGLTYELMRGSCNSLTELEYHLEEVYKATIDQLDWVNPEAYTAYSNPRGFIYQNRDKKIRLMRIDELHKFSDGTLNDVHNALDDRLKGIRMQYLPTIIWRKRDKDRAAAMIQAIDKMLKTRRIMRSLERKASLILEILSRRFFLKLNLSDHRSILMDLQETLKRKWRYQIPAKPPIYNHMLIPNNQDFKIQDFHYSDGFECFQAIKIGRTKYQLADMFTKDLPEDRFKYLVSRI
nr:hypothetical protein [Tanacetum cinerariifolium]